MNRTRRKTIEFRFYELPQSESVIGLAGEKWYGSYGNPERADELHFHNLFEFGYCRHGTGTMYFRDIPNRYREGMFTLIPAYYPHNTVSDGSNYWEYIFFDPIRLVRELFPANPGLQHIESHYAENISRLIKERITPIPDFVLSPEIIDEKNILILRVLSGSATPYYYKADGKMEAFIRVGSETISTPDYML